MSNKVKNIKKNVNAKRNLEQYTLFGTLIGSIIVSIGKCVGMKEDEMIDWFAYFSKDEELAKCKNVQEVCDYIIKKFGMPEEYKKSLVLVTDNNNLYTPLVSICIDDVILPLDRKGMSLGILSHLDEVGIEVEFIYE